MRGVIAVVCLAVLVAGVGVGAEESRWEKHIQAFEKQDQEAPPPKGAILFIGSSSIVRWKTDEDFPKHTIINRGFGGSYISDSVEFVDRIAIPYAPRLIVMYAGGNDIASGKSAERVFGDFKEFIEVIHAALPKTKIVFVCIKPSTDRWSMIDTIRETNDLVAEYTKKNELLEYVDIDTPMLGEDGKPREELLGEDGLHLSRAGYDVWNGLVRPHLGPGKK